MGLFDKIKKFVTAVFKPPIKKKEVKKHVPAPRGVAPKKRGAPPLRPVIDRTVKPTNPEYRRVWDSLQDEMEEKLSITGAKNFNREQDRLRALYDVWSDPSEDDGIQRDAYAEFFDTLADYGFSIADFDWSDFSEVYTAPDQ